MRSSPDTFFTLADGLYWYMVPGLEPEPVLINKARYPGRFKCFNGREQAWIREGERLIGPVHPPVPSAPSESSTQSASSGLSSDGAPS
jgi:hypothetical protein